MLTHCITYAYGKDEGYEPVAAEAPGTSGTARLDSGRGGETHRRGAADVDIVGECPPPTVRTGGTPDPDRVSGPEIICLTIRDAVRNIPDVMQRVIPQDEFSVLEFPELKPVPGWPGYFASSDGKVYSLRTNGGKVGTILKERKGTPTRDGYLCLRLHQNQKTLFTGVHSVVCRAFHGPKIEGKEVCHLNDVRTDNRSENLRWDTPAGNIRDRDERGRTAKGSRHGMAKLTEQDIAEFRRMREEGLTGAAIASRWGLNRSTVNRALRGSIWKHTKEGGPC